MTIHTPGSPTYGWRCTCPGCTGPRSVGAGYPSASAAARAENHHRTQARHTDPDPLIPGYGASLNGYPAI